MKKFSKDDLDQSPLKDLKVQYNFHFFISKTDARGGVIVLSDKNRLKATTLSKFGNSGGLIKVRYNEANGLKMRLVMAPIYANPKPSDEEKRNELAMI